MRDLIKPEPFCAEPLRLYGHALECDRPKGHLPTDEHAATVHWSRGVRPVSAKSRRRDSSWPPDVRHEIEVRDDHRCVGPRAGLPLLCSGWPLEIDHVRASGGMGMKSRSTADNGVLLCPGHHLWKTTHGREARPDLLAYLASVAV